MEIKYTVHYYEVVAKNDIPKLSSVDKMKIKRAIGKKLIFHPHLFGLPLRYPLHGLWKLRVGDYRIVFKILKQEIHIIAVKHRREIYKAVEKRV